MKLTNAQLIELDRGLSTLDAGHEVTVDGKNVRRPFKYGAVVHFPLQQNAAAIKPHVEVYLKANKALFASHAETYTNEKGEPAQRVPTDKFPAYKEQAEALLAQIVMVKLFQIKLSEFKRGTGDAENPIMAMTINDLGRTVLNDVARDQLVEVPDEDAEKDPA